LEGQLTVFQNNEVPQEDVSQLLENIQNQPLYAIRDGTLCVRGGAVMQAGTRAVLSIGMKRTKAGTIQNVTKVGIDFLTDKGEVVTVPLLSLNVGIDGIEKC
jgi:hypothetical protein